ncbi:alpha/beta fold hydrolase [Staphylococcus canis]|uniref:Alpha/beta hydrolase n=1 Tax=Staphylococcus canis TaxID=2724942 RepID=A0ABS0TB94_9STAP|nr:alpha/beta hydrolase [Staphylococcus canis]MBI5975682.1 alpha/beta hydrolase [Staphylococcus canis]
MWKWETDREAKGVIVIVHNMLEHTGRYAFVITQLRRSGYHVIMGDLPGQGQTSRMHKGQIEHFEVYHERVLEWLSIAEEYHLPIFMIGVGLGGLISVNLLEKIELRLEGLILLSPLLAFINNNQTRRHTLMSNIGDISKNAKFNFDIKYEDLTRNNEVLEDTYNDALMLKKVSYHWYQEVVQTMKLTFDNRENIKDIPLCIMCGSQDRISDIDVSATFSKQPQFSEVLFKVWDGLNHEIHNEPERDIVMKYILSFLNNRVYASGFLFDDENALS